MFLTAQMAALFLTKSSFQDVTSRGQTAPRTSLGHLWYLSIYDTYFSISTFAQSVNNAPHLQCNASLDTNSGCGVIEWSQASYGPYFEQQGGGVYAMKWDENSIAICECNSIKERLGD
jgi:hypothetical protein